MITITSTRIKKAFLHPGAALHYVKNYLKGVVLKINSKKGLSSKIVKSLGFQEWVIDDLIESALKSSFLIETAKRILNNEF